MYKVTLLSLSLILTSIAAIGQDDVNNPKGANETGPTVTRTISKVAVKDSIYMFKGKGGNIGVSIGENGVLMIDNQFANVTPELLSNVRNLTNRPIQFLVNTHHHGDHTGGNENMNENGTVIYAHDNVRKRLITASIGKARDSIMKIYNDKMATAGENTDTSGERQLGIKKNIQRALSSLELPNSLPMITFSEDMTFYYNGQKVMVFHVHNAHTDGDVMVYFTESNVIHTGDAYIKGKYPYIDVKNGGSLDGYISGLSNLLMLIDEETKIIPGHGSLATKKDVDETYKMMKYLKDRVTYYVATGKTYEEILTLEDVSKAFDEKGFGDGFISTEKFVKVLFDAGKRKYPKATKK